MGATLTLDQDKTNVHFGDVVSFSYTVTGHEKGRPQIQVACYQAGVLVYGAPGWADEHPSFMLGPTESWPGGAATGKAALYDQEIVAPFHVKLLAECDFTVLP